jgi:hypothetical protein
METLTRLVSESLARHGFDRPLDYRRLQWSRWFRCESHHSLLSVPSKPGVFALAEEITCVEAGAAPVPAVEGLSQTIAEERCLSAATGARNNAALAAASPDTDSRRMLAVTKFFEDDDMAFTLDRMVSFQNPMRARLTSGRYFVRYVVIEDPSQRRSICSALNQWIVSSAEKVTGIGAHFATSLDITSASVASQARVELGASPVPRTRGGAAPSTLPNRVQSHSPTAPQVDSGAAANIHCPSPFPSGF